MVRCDEFYEKCEKDGNFCDMSERTWSGVTRYIKEYWSALFHTGKKVPFSEAAWLKQQRKTAKAHIRQTKGLLRGEIAPTLPIAPVAPIGPTGPGCEMIETEVNGIMVPISTCALKSRNDELEYAVEVLVKNDIPEEIETTIREWISSKIA